MLTFIAGLLTFSIIALVLTFAITAVESRLVKQEEVDIEINDDPEKSIQTDTGNNLLDVLHENDILLSSACGGQGTCGMCKCQIPEGGGDVLPTEETFINYKMKKENYRLACQVKVRDDMEIILPEEIFNVEKWECTVRSNENVATFIKELVLELPEGEDVGFKAGGYIQIEAPPFELSFKDFDIKDKYKPDWDEMGLWKYNCKVDEEITRAYSMANYPEEKGVIILNVRIAIPPRDNPNVPPGEMSSYIFNLKPGDSVTISGPYGEFYARDTDKEMIFIGGGAGMAPMRSHIFDQLKRLNTDRKISFWYGARSLREVFYDDDFDRLEEEHDNFEWHLALSDPRPEDDWRGLCGFIHKALYENYLKDHPNPEDCEYYICGPPLMLEATRHMLYKEGVEEENILYDDFG